MRYSLAVVGYLNEHLILWAIRRFYFHSRRMNCMGVLLLPITLNMGGLGPAVVRLMGLM